jgi:hypothetical protein
MIIVTILFGLMTIFIGCSMQQKFWKYQDIGLQETQTVSSLVTIGDSTIIIGGIIRDTAPHSIATDKPFVRMSFNWGKAWRDKYDFDANTIERIVKAGSELVVQGLKHVNDTNLILNSKYVYYVCEMTGNTWRKIETPDGRDLRYSMSIKDGHYLFNATKNQFGETYVLTSDGGTTWEEHLLLMSNEKDMYQEKCVSGNYLWGIRTQASDKKSMVAVNLDNWRPEFEIDLSNGEDVTEVKTTSDELYILSHKGDKGYLKKLITTEKRLRTIATFILTQSEEPIHAYVYNSQIIVVTIEMKKYLPSYYVLFSSDSGENWEREKMPELSYPLIDFSGGRLAGIMKNKQMYYRQF